MTSRLTSVSQMRTAFSHQNRRRSRYLRVSRPPRPNAAELAPAISTRYRFQRSGNVTGISLASPSGRTPFTGAVADLASLVDVTVSVVICKKVSNMARWRYWITGTFRGTIVFTSSKRDVVCTLLERHSWQFEGSRRECALVACWGDSRCDVIGHPGACASPRHPGIRDTTSKLPYQTTI